jgi:hypothetical protein
MICLRTHVCFSVGGMLNCGAPPCFVHHNSGVLGRGTLFSDNVVPSLLLRPAIVFLSGVVGVVPAKDALAVNVSQLRTTRSPAMVRTQPKASVRDTQSCSNAGASDMYRAAEQNCRRVGKQRRKPLGTQKTIPGAGHVREIPRNELKWVRLHAVALTAPQNSRDCSFCLTIACALLISNL